MVLGPRSNRRPPGTVDNVEAGRHGAITDDETGTEVGMTPLEEGMRGELGEVLALIRPPVEVGI
jgi:hypothetical protein